MEHEYQEWYNTIASYERGFKEWESRVDRIVKRYRDESRTRNNPMPASISFGQMFRLSPQLSLPAYLDPM